MNKCKKRERLKVLFESIEIEHIMAKNAHEIIIRMASTAIFMRIYALYTSLPLEYTKGNLWIFRSQSYKTENLIPISKMDFEKAKENHSIIFLLRQKSRKIICYSIENPAN